MLFFFSHLGVVFSDLVIIEMASAGFSSYSTTPSTSMEQLHIPASAVNCASYNAVCKMQTIAELLLLQSDDNDSITIQPLFNTDNDFTKCKDTIIKNAKGLAVTIRQINHQLRQRLYGSLCKSLDLLADQIVTVTEATAHMAYSNAVDSITSDKQQLFNRYMLVKCELDITAACKCLQFEYGIISSEELLKITSGISDHVTSIKRICLEAKDLETIPSEEKVQISLLSDTISAAFVSFVNCLKILMSNPQSSECRQKCLILSKPLLASIASLRQITDSTLLSNIPVLLEKKSSEPMTVLLGSAMAIVSSTVRYVESAQSVVEDMDENSSWKSLVNCSKSVAESATLMATSLKSTPYASKRNSFCNSDI